MIGYVRQGWLVLLLGLLFGFALAGVNGSAEPTIKANQKAAREKAAVEVVPGGSKATEEDVGGTTVYRVTDESDQRVGWGIPASGQGYADTIRLIVGVDAEATELTGFDVIYNQETPGLGNRIDEPDFRSRFKGKDPATHLKPVQKPVADDEIQALTGATISSRAVADIIYKQLNDTGLLTKLRERAGGASASQAAAEN